ncbi:Zn-dependent hydrolase [Bordetella holmesii]|uniref:N-carbamoyl-L-amino acid hydrolase n=3 Tax=Bordetella holmesii TaxID=35814 RepID=A0ABN0RYR2_9BORD|nr:Zn-dependent hydrolase [Bordetella holmesii]AHV93796.1 N-carbamoyl-L-amino acid hydrolase [Bordetella holmesii ATCC 51541]AIT28391.1 N-carbamoyl-L-amino acid hydrolase [Bordetella holmesii 44057]EWM42952.1 N-carbamoyl-L-amino acid hydrolase [Bordetella holmesii 41130]EWM45072.1 N-carbamoyl-L-amino acid hydrolase [Bordetella holmesii 70147]AMD47057.1 allantoate amidohydrolase [Bordetella holmesii H558]
MSTTVFPPIDADRLWSRIETLSRMTVPGQPWTRRAFTPLFDQARTWLRAEFDAAGLSSHIDAAGNLVGRMSGRNAEKKKPLVTGSHCDTVLEGGRFDGIIGVLAGIEVAHTLKDHGLRLDHPFEVIDFLSEEPSDYGISCVGSRAISGHLTADMLAACNPDGETLAQGIVRAGGRPDALGQALRGPDTSAAFVELHIEQGPVLQARGLPIGVVSNIVGIRRTRIVVLGQPDHAGTTPMDIRRDALVGAARIIDAAHHRATDLAGRPHYVVATVGRLTLTPNAANAVPGRVDMTLEVRSDSNAVLDSFTQAVLQTVTPELAALRLTVQAEPLSRAEPTDCARLVMEAVRTAADSLGYDTMTLPSGAGHDAMYMAPTGPMGMIFIPCLDGRSHCPQEWITPEQLLDGTRVLYQTLLELDTLA